MAGSNRLELEKVLTHYSQSPTDSLQLKAAEFLIINMKYHYTMENKSLSSYYQEIIKINNDSTKAQCCRNMFDSLGLKYYLEDKDLKIKYDIQTVKADYLIKNIDYAINHWYTNPWAQHLSFADFCEYVLPYRIGNENIENWREKIAQKNLKKIDWINTIDEIRNSCYWAARFLSDTLNAPGFNLYTYATPAPIDQPASILHNIKLGTCDMYAQAAVYNLRACGIPVCIDFTPQWPNRSLGHTWNVLFDEKGKEIPFMGGEISPGIANRPGEPMAKVYRKTFSYQHESLFHIKKEEKIPALFDNPYIKDVTNNYYTTVDVELELFDKTKNRFAYLAVFDDANWVPIQWAEVKNGNRVTFNAMGKNCMYLPVFYENEMAIPAAQPFIVDIKGNIRTISENINQKQQLVLKRKYPIRRTIYIHSKLILSGRVEASNSPNFKDSVVAGIIKRDPRFDWDTISCVTSKKYRFWRFKAEAFKWCNIAELQFITTNKNITDTTLLIHNMIKNDTNLPINLFDNNKLTYVQLKGKDKEWVGLDFGKPVKVDYFKFMPRNDDNAIVAGDRYELVMWDKTGWKSLIKCVATSDKLIFKNVPTGGLYLLHNLTKGKEERIFTYQNGQQVWW